MVSINYNDNDNHEKVAIIKNNGRIGIYFSNKQRFYCFRFIVIYWRIYLLFIILFIYYYLLL